MLFLLRLNEPIGRWYDKALGFVVRAVDEVEARELAQERGGDESLHHKVWLDVDMTSCVELSSIGPSEIILRDHRGA